jgi:hypothetical protein
MPGDGSARGKGGETFGLEHRLHGTLARSRAGEIAARDGVHDARPSHRHRAAASRVRADAEGWRDGDRRADGRGVRRESRREPGLAARPVQVGALPSAARTSRAHPEGDGSKTRLIGIPTFEDKVLQRAVTMVLEAIYEQDFSSCSYCMSYDEPSLASGSGVSRGDRSDGARGSGSCRCYGVILCHLQRSCIRSCRSAASPPLGEPDAGNLHVRI